MPELPEVETIRRDLDAALKGAEITDIWTDTPKMLQPSVEAVRKGVVGQEIIGVGRRAKVLIVNLADGSHILIHLKLSGRLLLRKPGDPKDDFVHVVFKLKVQSAKLKVVVQSLKFSEVELRFADLRKFGYVKLVDEDGLKKVLSGLGPEPLDDLTFDYLKKTLAKTKKPIKIVLMDQEKFSGIGNIYANEALFAAGISPLRSASSLSDAEAKMLFEAIEKVIKIGIESRGTTAKDDFYLDAYGKPGYNEENLRIYQKDGEKCGECGATVKRVNLGGRGTFYCPKCQK